MKWNSQYEHHRKLFNNAFIFKHLDNYHIGSKIGDDTYVCTLSYGYMFTLEDMITEDNSWVRFMVSKPIPTDVEVVIDSIIKKYPEVRI